MTTDTPPPADRPPDKAPAPPPEKAAGPTGEKPLPLAAVPLVYIAAIAVLLVVAAVGAGLALGTVARPSPTPRPTPTTAPPTPTPVPTTDPQVFRQQLSSGCATDQGIWVVSNGGGLLRYDGAHWTQIDSTLRTLNHASCDDRTLYAVGPVGAVLIVDDRARSIQSFDVTITDLRSIAAMPQGAMASGALGTVMVLFGGTWQPYASGIEEDLNALVVFGLESAWAVGSQGISYRLEPAGWRAVPTGVDATLRGIAGPTSQSAIAVGDAGTLLSLSGLTWSKIDSGTTVPLRSVAVVGPTVWTVGDDGVVLVVDGAIASPGVPPRATVVERIDIGTTCALTGVFARGSDIWVIGASGGEGGVWRIRDKKVAERWGEC